MLQKEKGFYKNLHGKAHKMFQVKICKYAYSLSQNHVTSHDGSPHHSQTNEHKYEFQNSKCTGPRAILTVAVMWCCVLMSKIRYILVNSYSKKYVCR